MSASNDPFLTPSPAADLLRVHPPETLRHRAMRAALDWKAAWLRLGATLTEAQQDRAWVSFGFRSMKLWAEGELGVPATMARRMLQGFEWMQDEAPELARPALHADGPGVDRPVPDPNTVAALADARRKVDESIVPAAVYEDLRTRALRGESGATEVKRELKAFVDPTPESDENADLPRVKKALRGAEKLLEQIGELGEPPPELVQLVADLRDRLYLMLSQMQRENRDDDLPPAPYDGDHTHPGHSVVLPPPRVATDDDVAHEGLDPIDDF